MYSLSIIEVSDPKWADIILSANQYDFYHTQSYSKLENGNKPLLFTAYRNNDFIAMPLVIRDIEGTDYFDCTSLYGYCGPVSNLPYISISKEHISFFQKELMNFFKSSSIISAFSRLHPLFNQKPVLENLGEIIDINKTVVIDLTLSEEEQIGQYRKNHRKDIARLRNEGFEVSEAKTLSEIDSFIRLYYDLMKKINADASYFFERNYFYSFLDNPCYDGKLFLAKKNDMITAGGLFSYTQNVMQAHLVCDDIRYRNQSPVKLVFDHARQSGCDHNMKFLHLGGGRFGCSDDSLFHFKAGFSKKTLMFSGWQLIIDELKYTYLKKLFNVSQQGITYHFPAYRTRFVEK